MVITVIEPDDIEILEQGFRGRVGYSYAKHKPNFSIEGIDALRVARLVLDDLIWGPWRAIVDNWEENLGPYN